jgi:hypothetical protein
MIIVCGTFNPCNFLAISMQLPLFINFGVSNLACFLVVSNRLWAHTKQKFILFVDTRKSEVLCIEEKNHLLKLKPFVLKHPKQAKT